MYPSAISAARVGEELTISCVAPSGSTVYASVLPLRGRELWEAQAAQSTIDHRIMLRWRPGVKHNTRVLLGDRKFEVLYIIDQGERHEWLQMMCRELEE